ncbi:MAG: FeoB-associated Cys-rich membrane protein [Bacteroidota bacterium]
MIQEFIVGAIFLAALFFLGRLVYRAFKGNPSCSGGCDSCNTIDVDAIEKKINTISD